MGASRLPLLIILLHSLLLVVLVIVVEHVAAQGCPNEGWHYYKEGNTCLRPNKGIAASYLTARNTCKQNGGLLVTVRTKAKEKFVRKLRPFPGEHTWIGVHDFDRDGVFNHLATGEPLLPNKAPGLGDWGYAEGSTTGPCVSMGIYGNGWRSEDCSIKHQFTCEIDLRKSSAAHCVKDSWKYLEKGKKYVTLFSRLLIHKFAVEDCEGFGGNLVSVHDPSSILEAIRGLEVTQESYWIGLVRVHPNTTTSAWAWVDGTPLKNNDYQKRSSGVPGKFENCAAIKVTSGEWEPQSCKEGLLMSICEARVSCSSRPVFRITHGNNGQIVENDTAIVKLATRELLYVICLSKTGSDTVKKISLSCNWDVEILGQDSNSPYTSLDVNINLHRKKCSCQTTSRFGDQEHSWMSIAVQTNPFVRNENDSVQKAFVGPEGSNVLVRFDAFISNPYDIQTAELRKKGRVVDDSKYRISVTPVENSIYSSVTLTMLNVRLGSAGEYTLRGDNNAKKSSMEFDFLLHVTEKVPEAPVFSVTSLALMAFLLVTLVLVMNIVFHVWKWMKGRRRREEQETKEAELEDLRLQGPEENIEKEFVIATATQRTGQSTMLD